MFSFRWVIRMNIRRQKGSVSLLIMLLILVTISLAFMLIDRELMRFYLFSSNTLADRACKVVIEAVKNEIMSSPQSISDSETFTNSSSLTADGQIALTKYETFVNGRLSDYEVDISLSSVEYIHRKISGGIRCDGGYEHKVTRFLGSQVRAMIEMEIENFFLAGKYFPTFASKASNVEITKALTCQTEGFSPPKWIVPTQKQC